MAESNHQEDASGSNEDDKPRSAKKVKKELSPLLRPPRDGRTFILEMPNIGLGHGKHLGEFPKPKEDDMNTDVEMAGGENITTGKKKQKSKKDNKKCDNDVEMDDEENVPVESGSAENRSETPRQKGNGDDTQTKNVSSNNEGNRHFIDILNTGDLKIVKELESWREKYDIAPESIQNAAVSMLENDDHWDFKSEGLNDNQISEINQQRKEWQGYSTETMMKKLGCK